jgi:hypothetical protein
MPISNRNTNIAILRATQLLAYSLHPFMGPVGFTSHSPLVTSHCFSNRKPEILEPHLTTALSTQYPVLIANFEPCEMPVLCRNSNEIHESRSTEHSLQNYTRTQTELAVSHSKQRATLLFDGFNQRLRLRVVQDSAIVTKGIHLVPVSAGGRAILPVGPVGTFWYSNCTRPGAKAVRGNSTGVRESSSSLASLMDKHLTINPTVCKKAKGLEMAGSHRAAHSPWGQI